MKKQFLFLAVLLSFLSSHVSATQMYDFIVDGVYYKIQYGTQKTVHVAPKSYSDNSERWTSGHTGDVVIPESVTYNGETYPVEGIANYAFYGSSVTSVSIPASVQYIYGTAFQGCRQLTKIINLSPTPQNITSTTFDSYDCALYVPDGSVSAYQSANNWNNFTIKSVSELNSFSVLDVAVQRGTPQSIDINLDNISTNIVGFQFDLRLPEGFSLVTTSTGAVDVTATSRLCGSYTLRGKLQSDGTYRFVYVANPNGNSAPTPISGTSGSLFSVKIQAGDAAKDGVATVSNITITDNNVNETSLNDASFNITVAKSGKCGDNLTWSLDDDGLLKVEGSGPMYDYAFSYDTYAPNTPWYSYKDEITSVEFSENMTSIGNESFEGCANLTSIVIPDAVTSIGEFAFAYCQSLKSVSIGSGLNSIGGNAFEDSNIAQIHIKDLAAWCNIFGTYHLTTYGPASKSLYINGEEISNLEIPDGTKSIPSHAFYCFKNISTVVIPNSVTRIADRAFRNCLNLNEVYNYATSPQTITSDTFHPNTHTLYVPKASVSAYQKANYWKDFTIKPIITVIASGECGDNLTWTLDDEGLLTISGTGDMFNYSYSPDNAAPWYSYRSEIKSLSIGNSVTSIGDRAFSDSNLTSVIIGNSVTCIGGGAFDGCTDLTSIFIPNSVTTIGSNAFNSCYGLTSVKISDLAAWCNIDFSYYESNPLSHAHNIYLNESLLSDLVIPNTVSEIKNYTFYGCYSITSVTMPNNVTSIGNYAFAGCQNLTTIAIPNSVTNIKNGAYYNCTGLTSVTIGNSVANIGEWSFGHCSGLTSIEIPNCVKTIGNKAFALSGLTSVTIPNSVTSIGSQAFASCRSLSSVELPNSVTNIEWETFARCSSLTSVTIGNNVTSIGESAFHSCSSLSSITIPNSVTSIGEHVFDYCYNLTSITLGKNVKNIGECSFFDCAKLNSVHNLATEPLSLDYDVFGNYGTLYVPAASVTAYQNADYWKEFTIVGVENGDVNLDNKVNVTDAVEVVSNVIGDASERFVECWSDVNSDNQYTIADAMAVVNIILGEEIGASYAMNHAPMAENDQLSLYSTDSSNLTLAMDNMMQYSSFQFDVVLPEGMTLENVTLNQNRCQDFSVLFREMEEGRWTVAVFNFGNEPFATGTGALVDMSISGSGNLSEATVSNIHFSTTRAVDVQFEDISMSNTNGIDILNENEYENENIYDLSGRRLNGTQHGVNIINGKKIIIR